MSIVTLTSAKNYLGIALTDTSNDGLLQPIVDGVDKALSEMGIFEAVTARAEIVNGAETLMVQYYPITTLTSIVDNVTGETISATAYTADLATGIIYHDSGTWATGRARYTITYNGGVSTPPKDVVMAGLIWVATIYNAPEGFTGERMGDYSYTKDAKGLPAEVQTILSNYRKNTTF